MTTEKSLVEVVQEAMELHNKAVTHRPNSILVEPWKWERMCKAYKEATTPAPKPKDVVKERIQAAWRKAGLIEEESTNDHEN